MLRHWDVCRAFASHKRALLFLNTPDIAIKSGCICQCLGRAKGGRFKSYLRQLYFEDKKMDDVVLYVVCIYCLVIIILFYFHVNVWIFYSLDFIWQQDDLYDLTDYIQLYNSLVLESMSYVQELV